MATQLIANWQYLVLITVAELQTCRGIIDKSIVVWQSSDHIWVRWRSLPFLTHWGRYNMDAILQTTFSNDFSWMKMCECRLRFHWNLFRKFESTIFHHWFRKWHGADCLMTHICVTRPHWVNLYEWYNQATDCLDSTLYIDDTYVQSNNVSDRLAVNDFSLNIKKT